MWFRPSKRNTKALHCEHGSINGVPPPSFSSKNLPYFQQDLEGNLRWHQHNPGTIWISGACWLSTSLHLGGGNIFLSHFFLKLLDGSCTGLDQLNFFARKLWDKQAGFIPAMLKKLHALHTIWWSYLQKENRRWCCRLSHQARNNDCAF